MSPTRLFRIVATAEAFSWAGLILGLVLKYGTETTDVAVRVFGPIHGAVFLAYCVTVVVVWVDRRWSFGRAALALVAAVPPFATVPLEWYAARRGWLGDTWRLPAGAGTGLADRAVSWVLLKPLRGLAVAAVAVAVLFGVALLIGPPTS
ncbi:DUF3817 domain-containing protein [Nocardioides sp. zg-536]|uniref:DUF3817 domain-containing protein n=1 Tax=Nocardioides faecalis TaxID=2803858 RepID=A0A939BV38_9ACTN|nr:DUF3817 domain-containing protein [Nocardioides faecalis]MBM9459521.1 DUF3817 domain-containing protein [Nocardioides faecalis]MBS4753699.1 DUF3817 domain-containing protein [Nocardioides faecalis]QVI58057.1 DUF3817 domain-containing protein [Nocardioides faecalis]